MRKYLLILPALLGVGISPVAFIGIQAATIPSNERFVVPSAQVLEYRELPYKAASSSPDIVVEYSYKKAVTQALPNEVPELRTQMSRTQKTGDTYTTSFVGTEYYEEAGVWYDLGFATTTKASYELQKQSLIPLADATTDTFSSSGTWTAPVGVCKAQVDGWGGGAGGGAGGNGSNDGGVGGGGGAYSQLNSFSVSAGTGYTVTVGTGGAAGIHGTSGPGNGQDTIFNTSATLLAKGGVITTGNGDGGGNVTNAGGAAASGVGDVKTSGGASGSLPTGGTVQGSGGGGSGGDTTGGGNGANGNAKGGGNASGGTAGTTNGAAGGAGGDQVNGIGGTIPGAAGGGGGNPGTGNSGIKDGGAGVRGEVDVIYTVGQGCSTGGSPAVSIQNTNIIIKGGNVIIK